MIYPSRRIFFAAKAKFTSNFPRSTKSLANFLQRSNRARKRMSVNNKISHKAKPASIVLTNIAAMVLLMELPKLVNYGMGVIFCYIIAALLFLLPATMATLQLCRIYANGHPTSVFCWVGQALGWRWGLLAQFLQWTYAALRLPSVLLFGVIAVAYAASWIEPMKWVCENKMSVIIIVLIIYWAAVLISMRGLETVTKAIKISAIVGLVVPTILLAGLVVVYFTTSAELIPERAALTKYELVTVSLQSVIFFMGIEFSSTLSPATKGYRKSLLPSGLIVLLIFCIVSFALAGVLAVDTVASPTALFTGFYTYLGYAHIPMLMPLVSIAVVGGVFAVVLSWSNAPSLGIYQAAKRGYLPPFLQKCNKRGVHTNVLLVQAGVVTFTCILFVIVPSVHFLFSLIVALAIGLYLLMYLLIFASSVATNRTTLSWVVALTGGGTTMGALVWSLRAVDGVSPLMWYLFVVIALVVLTVAPLVIYSLRKPSWRNHLSNLSMWRDGSW